MMTLTPIRRFSMDWIPLDSLTGGIRAPADIRPQPTAANGGVSETSVEDDAAPLD